MLLGAALVLALVVGPWLAVVAARLTDRNDAARSGLARTALLTAVLAAAAAFGVGALAAAIAPAGLGLLGLLLGLVVGALVSVVLLATRGAPLRRTRAPRLSGWAWSRRPPLVCRRSCSAYVGKQSTSIPGSHGWPPARGVAGRRRGPRRCAAESAACCAG